MAYITVPIACRFENFILFTIKFYYISYNRLVYRAIIQEEKNIANLFHASQYMYYQVHQDFFSFLIQNLAKQNDWKHYFFRRRPFSHKFWIFNDQICM